MNPERRNLLAASVRATLAIAVLTGVGCTAAGPGTKSEITLRPGVVLLHATEEPIQYETSSATFKGAFFWTNDMSVAGGRITLSGAAARWSHYLGTPPSVDPDCGCASGGSGVVGTGSGSQILYVSTDAGVTWARQDVPAPAPDPKGHPLVTTRGLGIAEWQGAAAALLPQLRSDFEDLPIVHRLASFDTDTATSGPLFEQFAVFGLNTWSVSGSRVGYGYRDSSQNKPVLGTYDLATGDFVWTYLDEESDARCIASYYRLIGESFYGVCVQYQGTTPVAQCLQKAPIRPDIPGTYAVKGQVLGCVPLAELDPDLGINNLDPDIKPGGASQIHQRAFPRPPNLDADQGARRF